MATTPQGDDPDVRASVMHTLARAVARQRIAATAGIKARKARKLAATYSLITAPTRGTKR